jgi:hypothetical protein
VSKAGVEGVGLQPLAGWNFEFQSCLGHRRLCL